MVGNTSGKELIKISSLSLKTGLSRTGRKQPTQGARQDSKPSSQNKMLRLLGGGLIPGFTWEVWPPNRSPPPDGAQAALVSPQPNPAPNPLHRKAFRFFSPGSVKNNIAVELRERKERRVRSQAALRSPGRGDDERQRLSAAAEMNMPNEKLT